MGNSDHGATYMRVGRDDGEFRPWHYIYVYSIALWDVQSRLSCASSSPGLKSWCSHFEISGEGCARL